jgi:hypothetical protein
VQSFDDVAYFFSDSVERGAGIDVRIPAFYIAHFDPRLVPMLPKLLLLCLLS